MGGSAERGVGVGGVAASIGATAFVAASDGSAVGSTLSGTLADTLGCGVVEALEGAAEAVGETTAAGLAVAGAGLAVAGAAQTPAGETGATGLPAAGTYRKPSASPSRSARLEIPTLASRHEPPALATKTAQ
jgi:hypothetical protein